MTVLPRFGPFWRIHIRFTLESLHNDGWASILQITNGEDHSRYPTIQVYQGKLYIISNVGNNPNYYNGTWDVEIGQTYDIVMNQEESLEDNNVLKLRMDINGENYMDTLNGHWLMLENAKVFYSDPFVKNAKVTNTTLNINYVVASWGDAHFRYNLNGKVRKIITKTGIFTNSETNQELKVDICSDNGQCCTTDRLDNPGQEFQRGKLDTFEGSVLGQCSNYNLNGLSKVQVKLSGTDGWYGTFLKVYLNNDIIYHCPINQWIDNSSILRLHCSLFDF